jgi:muramoyltetrapeptide carboxypeptidase
MLTGNEGHEAEPSAVGDVAAADAGLLAPPLRPGGTIAVVAPAEPFRNRSDVQRGVQWWQAQGYEVRLADNIGERTAMFAGSPRQRADAINQAFADDSVHAIQCLHGGYGSTELVPLLDFDLIAVHPKPFVGGSDVTVLHTALARRTGLVSFYGPGLTQVARPDTPEMNQRSLLAAITDARPLGAMPTIPGDPFVRRISSGKAAGRTVGGALWVLCMTIGTPWQVDLAGKILLVEEIGEPPWRLDAMFTLLRQAGLLDGVAGIAVGELVDCDWSESRPETPFTLLLEDVLERQLAGLGVPCLYGFPFGHGRHKATVPLGVQAQLDADAGTLTFVSPALSAAGGGVPIGEASTSTSSDAR